MDQLWIVCDVDRWQYDSQIKTVKNVTISRKPVNLAFSNPCFELFLYLHSAAMPESPVPSAKEMENMLRKELGRYSKNNLDENVYKDKVDHAIEEASKTMNSPDGIPLNPGTNVGKLVKFILEMRTKREL